MKPVPPRPFGNELTSTTGAFISTLQITDPKFSVLGFGPFLEDVPRRLEKSPILRTAAMAFSSAVTAVHSSQTTVQALKDYGTALTCMRNSFINNPSEVTKTETLCGVYLLMLSQVCWIDDYQVSCWCKQGSFFTIFFRTSSVDTMMTAWSMYKGCSIF